MAPPSTIASQDDIRAVRFQIKDYNSPPKYEDEVYCFAFEFALQKLSFDLNATYTAMTDVPYERKFLARKLATIQMCQVRASDAADTATSATDVAGDGGDITMVTVPGLQVQEGAEKTGAAHWLDLLDRLQAEYDGEVGQDGSPPPEDALPAVVSGVMFTTTHRTGSRRPYALDTPLPAPGSFAVALDVADAIVTWAKVQSMHFNRYEIFRSTDSAELDPAVITQKQRVRLVSDVHGLPDDPFRKTRWVDKNLDPGTYYYSMCVVNDNELRSYTSILSVTVP